MTNSSSNADRRYPRQNIIRKIASYIVDAREKQGQAQARESALKCILDLLSAVGAGIDAPGAVALRKTALETRPAGDIFIWFAGKTSSVLGAAWANSAAASELDLDDGIFQARGHPGAAVIPTALAVAQETGANLEEILTAIIIGYEVGTSISKARMTYGSTGTWSSYAVVATAAALRRTPLEVLEHALAIAGESAPNQSLAGAPAPRIPHAEGAHVKEGITWSVATGLDALALAENGFRGPRNILDAPRHYNFPDVLSLGSYQYICDTYFKPYCCCRHVHGALDALRQLIQQHSIEAHTIDAIEVETNSMGLRLSNWAEPENTTDVQYSHQYCLALIAFYGLEALLPLTDGVLNDSKVTQLAHKVKLSSNPDFDKVASTKLKARVTVTCGDQRFVSAVTEPKGVRLSWDELEQKFRNATRLVASGDQQNLVLAAMNDARAGNISNLTDCLSGLKFTSSN